MLLIRWVFEMNPGYFVCLLDIPVIIKLEIPLLTSFISMDLEEQIMVLVSIHMSLGRLFGMRQFKIPCELFILEFLIKPDDTRICGDQAA